MSLLRTNSNLPAFKESKIGRYFDVTGSEISKTFISNTTLIKQREYVNAHFSSSQRLWVLGATSHMGNNNRWAREGVVIDELLLENLYRNPEGNPLIFDTILLEKVILESNITLLLNTAVYETEKSDTETISGVKTFCSQNSTMYDLVAPLFCDGIVGFQAGAAFRMGAESRELRYQPPASFS